jgi:hypothetical protein
MDDIGAHAAMLSGRVRPVGVGRRSRRLQRLVVPKNRLFQIS